MSFSNSFGGLKTQHSSPRTCIAQYLKLDFEMALVKQIQKLVKCV